MKQLEAHEMPLDKVFCSDYDFRVPQYQRPYAWEIEQAQQLLSDLTEALDGGADEPYFLGSIVLVKQPSDSKAPHSHCRTFRQPNWEPTRRRPSATTPSRCRKNCPRGRPNGGWNSCR